MFESKKQEHLFEGMMKELKFKKKLEELGFVVEKSTKNQDIFEHWDFKIIKDDINLKIDLKGLKEQAKNNNLHWIEIKNVNNKVGWAYSEYVDAFVFELIDSWIMVDKILLQGLIKNKVVKIKVSDKNDCLYKLYTREGRKDILTMVTTNDLLSITKLKIIK